MAHNQPPNYGQGYDQGYSQQGYPQQSYSQPGYPQEKASQYGSQPSELRAASDSGTFQNLQYTIKHRNTNATLNFELQPGATVKSVPGVMVHMGSQVQMNGKIKISFKKMFTGSNMDDVTYVGPGVLSLAPTLMGDISTLSIALSSRWLVNKHALLAWTDGVVRDTKSQSFGKSLFSGDGVFVYNFSGNGLVWVKAYGAIEPIHLQPGEQHIVDNGHIVAWNCEYSIEKAGGGWGQAMVTGEGLVCRFTGPGTVFIQTRNLLNFEAFIRENAPGS